MNCPECGKEISDGMNYCVWCGKRLLKECPNCHKVVLSFKPTCDFCGINFSEYEDAMHLLEEGEKFEQRYKYEEAISKYECVQRPNDMKQEAAKRIRDLSEKLAIIAKNRELGEKLMHYDYHRPLKGSSIKSARNAFQEIKRLIPIDEQSIRALAKLDSLSKRGRKKLLVWIILVIIVGGLLGWCQYRNTLSYYANQGLKNLLDSQSLDIKSSASLVLAAHGKDDGIHILKTLANSNDERKRVYSLAVLLPFAEKQATYGLKDVLYNGSVPAKIGAGWALVNHGDTSTAVRLGVELLGRNEDLKIASAVLLFNLGYSEGIPVIEDVLQGESPGLKFKTLYALYLLGDKEMLYTYVAQWAVKVKKLLQDESEEVKLLAAFLLNKFYPCLSAKDSTIIEYILWNGFLRSKEKETPKIKELPEVNAFYIAKGIINGEGDEELTHFMPSASEIRQKCEAELSKIELGDKSAIEEAKKKMSSNDTWERLYGAIVGYRIDKRKANNVLKELTASSDEVLRLITCKLIYDFIIK